MGISRKQPQASHESQSTLKIKNMVCNRCIMVVDEVLRGRGLRVEDVQLGKAVVSPEPEAEVLLGLEQELKQKGFELVRTRRDELATAIKSELITYMDVVESHQKTAGKPPLLSGYLTGKLHRSYPTLSRAFTASEGMTIEKYLIRLRIERVKELLSYDEFTLSQIAWQLGYSSLQHLSGQFRQVVGIPVSEYRRQDAPSRRTLDKIR